MREQQLCADMAYDAADFREFLVLEGITPHLKHNPRGSENQEPETKQAYPARRWLVERTLSWLAKRRSIRIRWSKKARTGWRLFSSPAATFFSTWRFDRL